MKTRILKISYLPGTGNQDIPYLRLSGLWLRDAQFNVHDRVIIRVHPGRLEVLKQEGVCIYDATDKSAESDDVGHRTNSSMVVREIRE